MARTPLGRSIGQFARGVADALFQRNCFVAGTLVQMADGSVQKIEDVRAGDFVLAGSLGIGTSIVTRAGPCLSVSNIAWEPKAAGGVIVYNLKVDGDHNQPLRLLRQ